VILCFLGVLLGRVHFLQHHLVLGCLRLGGIALRLARLMKGPVLRGSPDHVARRAVDALGDVIQTAMMHVEQARRVPVVELVAKGGVHVVALSARRCRQSTHEHARTSADLLIHVAGLGRRVVILMFPILMLRQSLRREALQVLLRTQATARLSKLHAELRPSL